MKFSRAKYQNGSIRRVSRKTGADVWEYRFRDHTKPGSPLRQMTLSTLEYSTETKVRVALQSKLLELNGPASYKKENKPTFGLVIDRFIESERLSEILAQPPGQVTITDGSLTAQRLAIFPIYGNISVHVGALPWWRKWIRSISKNG